MKQQNVSAYKKRFETPEVLELTKKELESLRNDPLVYPLIHDELKLTNKEAELFIASLLDYQEDVHYCAACPGLERCAKAHPHFSLRLEREGDFLTRHYDPCAKMVSLASFKKRYLYCSFPAEWRDEDLRNIERSAASRSEVLKAMVKIVDGDERWLFLNGNVGSGRSFMLACLANYITNKKGQGAFCDCGTLLNDLKSKSIEDKEGFDEMMKALSEASILVLDDFGNEYKTEYVYTSILFPLLSARDRAGLTTCFASDFSIRDIVMMYKEKIGAVRANQFGALLNRRCVKEFDVTGVNLH